MRALRKSAPVLVLAIGIALAPRPAAGNAITIYAAHSTMITIVIITGLTALGTQLNTKFTAVGQVTDFEISGGQTLLAVDVNDVLFGEPVLFSGSGVFGSTTGDLSGSLLLDAQSYTVSIDNASVDDPVNPTVVGWDGITTELFSVGPTTIPVDVSGTGVTGGFTMSLSGGGSIPVSQSIQADGSTFTQFDFNPHVEIETTLDQETGLLTATVTVVPEPGTGFLVAAGLLGLRSIARRRG